MPVVKSVQFQTMDLTYELPCDATFEIVVKGAEAPVFFEFEKSGILDGFLKIPDFFIQSAPQTQAKILSILTSLSTDFLMFFHLF